MQRDLPLLRAWTDFQVQRAAIDSAGDASPDARGEAKQHHRSVWISNLHLGTPGCQAVALLGFLKHFDSEHLFLVGDIIYRWQLRRSWYWPQAHNDVVQKLLRKTRKGTWVMFIPGNHDEFARRYLGHNFGGIEVAEDWIHETADGRRLWIIHGDLFDGVIRCARWLAHLGDTPHETSSAISRPQHSAKPGVAVRMAWSVAIPITPNCATSTASPPRMMVTGSTARPRLSSTPTDGSRSSTGASICAGRVPQPVRQRRRRARHRPHGVGQSRCRREHGGDLTTGQPHRPRRHSASRPATSLN